MCVLVTGVDPGARSEAGPLLVAGPSVGEEGGGKEGRERED